MEQLTTSQKGAVAEAAVALAATELGLTVLRPLCEGRRYDIVIDLGPELLRVQCKLARLRNGVIQVSLVRNRYTPTGYVSAGYSAIEVDAVAAYAPLLRKCFLLPIAETQGRRCVHLRIDPTKNSQIRGIAWAHDYELERSLERHWSVPLDQSRGAPEQSIDQPDAIA